MLTASLVAAPEAGLPGNMSHVRRSNLALVLGRIAGASSGVHPSRAQLAASTGLTKASVSSLVLELLSAGLVREVGLKRQERGRPSIGLELDQSKAVMGMEVNVDYVSVGVVSLAGDVLIQDSLERDNRNSDPRTVMTSLIEVADATARAAVAGGIQIFGGGLAVPGLLGRGSPALIDAPNLGWKGASLCLERLLPGSPLGVRVVNEANAAALAELRRGAAKFSDFLFVSGEVGVGGGLVIGGELFTGPGGAAGEVGHVVVDPNGARCSCGGLGCLETVAGQDAISVASGLGGRPGARTRSETLAFLLETLASGDHKSLSAVSRAGHGLGLALASVCRVADIKQVILGGHLAVLNEWLRVSLLESLERYAPGKFTDSQVACSAVGQSGAILGAADAMISVLLESPHKLVA